jgi:hypothetical protein
MNYIVLFCPYISPTFVLFSKLVPRHWQNKPISISRHPLVIFETLKSKSLAVSRHHPERPFCPDLVLAFVLGYFSWESSVADSLIGLLTGDKDWFGVSLISYIQSSLLIHD